jgi:predicted DNA-binding transcriptional regulator YafY
MQTPNAKYTPNYKEHLIEVVVEVDKRKARHFKAKKYLSSQKIVEDKKDGSLILSYEVTQDMEMDEVIKKWLPYVKVISPSSLKQSIEKDLREYLQ